jgi:ethanolamine utilization protein EutN
VKVGLVVGTVTSTINHPFFDGERLLICDLVDRDEPTGDYLICTNRVDAGTGDTVLILDEGTSARQMYDIGTGPIRSVVVGIVDDVHEQDAGR